jgi:uncharacterized protein YkwD
MAQSVVPNEGDSAASVTADDAAPSPDPLSSAPDSSLADIRLSVLQLVNAERATVGVPDLRENPLLDSAAQAHAEMMAAYDCGEHICGPELDPRRRIELTGYRAPHLGENVATGQKSPEQAVAEWMASVHRENILSPSFTELGVGVAFGGQDGMYWVQDFGVQG